MAGEVLGLLREEMDQTLKEPQDLANMYQQELGECTREKIMKVGYEVRVKRKGGKERALP